MQDGKLFHAHHHAKALSTIGMLSRAGSPTDRGSALAVATAAVQEDMVKLLLDDYQVHIQMHAHSQSAVASVPSAQVCELTEADLVELFQTFPRLAADFLMDLPLVRTNLVSPESKCDFSAVKNGCLVTTSAYRSPHVGHFEDHSYQPQSDSPSNCISMVNSI